MEVFLVLNAALIGEPTSRVPEGDPGKVGGHLLTGPVAGDAGVSPVRAAGAVARRQRRTCGHGCQMAIARFLDCMCFGPSGS